jgi:hypothetical protein
MIMPAQTFFVRALGHLTHPKWGLLPYCVPGTSILVFSSRKMEAGPRGVTVYRGP